MSQEHQSPLRPAQLRPTLIEVQFFWIMFTPVKPNAGTWNKFADPRPYVSLAVFAVDWQGRFPILYRGSNVRSAKNCWSVPTGLHEVGLTAPQQVATELQEEVGIGCLSEYTRHVGVYENISAEDNWHWFISVYVVPTLADLDNLVNKEPDKHDEVRACERLGELLALPLAPSMNDALSRWSNLGSSPNLNLFVQDAQATALRAKNAAERPNDA